MHAFEIIFKEHAKYDVIVKSLILSKFEIKICSTVNLYP